MRQPGRIFISYRRNGGGDMARLLRDNLQSRGFRVFIDVEDLGSGRFNESLLREIELATDVIVVLSPGSLDGCHDDDGDWLRWEVAHAIANGKNVITVTMRGFVWPAEPLPEELHQLPYFQGIEPSHALFGASVEKLVSLLKARPAFWASRRARIVAATSVVGCLIFAVIFAVWLHQPSLAQASSAKYLCFSQDDWKKGVPLLAGQPGVLQPAAQAELQRKSNPLEIARLWSAAAEKLAAPDKWHCYRRSRFWFREALKVAHGKPDGREAEAINSELSLLPSLKATLRISGESFHSETIAVRRTSLTWITHSGSGPFVIEGLTSLAPFTFEYGKSATRLFTPEELHAVLPEGIDFTTARLAKRELGGKTGKLARIILEVFPDGSGVSIEAAEKQNFLGTFTFAVSVEFGR